MKISISEHCKMKKKKPKEVQYKILNEENKIWRIIRGNLTVRRKAKHAIGYKQKYEPWEWQ
jgi:hypothetical protein